MPGVDVDDPAVREQVQPLTSVPGRRGPEVAEAARQASTDAFHLAMIVSAGLLLAGAAINGFGIRNPARDELEAAAGGAGRLEPADRSEDPRAPRRRSVLEHRIGPGDRARLSSRTRPASASSRKPNAPR